MTHNNEFIDTLLYFQSGNKQSDAKEKCGMRQAFAEVFILLEHFDIRPLSGSIGLLLHKRKSTCLLP